MTINEERPCMNCISGQAVDVCNDMPMCEECAEEYDERVKQEERSYYEQAKDEAQPMVQKVGLTLIGIGMAFFVAALFLAPWLMEG